MIRSVRTGLALQASRVASGVGLLVVIGMLPWLSSRDPALTVLRARSAEREPDPQVLADIRAELKLSEGPVAVLTNWASGLLRADAGTSWVSGSPVLPAVVTALGVSLTLMAGALVVALVVCAALNYRLVFAGSRLGRRRSGGGVAAVFTSTPEFLLGAVLLIVVATWLEWAPPFGWEGPQHLVLPALALGVPAGGLLGRLVQDSLPATFGEPWVRTWAAAGLRSGRITHGVGRRALPALLPQLGLVVVGLTGGAVAVETLFAVPGLGRVAHGAALAQDLPMVQASVLALVLLGAVTGVLADLARRAMLGPALRAGALVTAPPPPRDHRRVPVVAVGMILLLAAILLVGLARDPVTVDGASRLAAPSLAHPFGADALGRDLLARVAHGALRTAGTAALVSAAALLIAMLAVLVPRVACGVAEAVNAVPPVLAGLLVAAATGPSEAGAAIAVLTIAWAPLAVHAEALLRQEWATTHVAASLAGGAGWWWLLRRHVLPAVLPPVSRHAVLRTPGVALALASLGFLGLGASPPTPEWGLVLAEALPYVERAPWAAIAPAGALAVLGALAVSLSTSSLPTRFRVRRAG